jgi:xanthine dehydrogenase YagT iron-sulfur-binding subunit
MTSGEQSLIVRAFAFELSRRSTVPEKPVGRSLLPLGTQALAAHPHVPRGSRGDTPVVLAFASHWSLDGQRASELEAIRSELRGLGAALVVVSSTGIWSFRPDDEVERFAASDRQVDEEVARLAEVYEIERSGDGAMAEAVFVLDAGGEIRFASRGSPRAAPMHATLASALAAAGRALIAPAPAPITVSRREWVTAVLVAGFALFALDGCNAPRTPAGARNAPLDRSVAPPPTGDLDVVLRVNGSTHSLRIEPRVSLLDVLRERIGLTGSKKGCDHGQCGACTVLVDNRRVCACLTLAIMVQGAEITTIEGLAKGDVLHPLQEAFIAQDALQCGYCTPGQIMSAVGLLGEGHAHTDDEVREQMSGNICRCGAYPNIVAAIQLARKGT